MTRKPKKTPAELQQERWRPFADAVAAGQPIVTLDPASKRTGLAIHRYTQAAGASDRGQTELICAMPCKAPAAWPAPRRIDQIVDQVCASIETYKASYAVIETTIGKTSKRHGGHGAGLAIYGWAVGAIRQAVRQKLGPASVLDVNENEWTARTSKHERWMWCRSRWVTYAGVWADDGKEDRMDVSDATYLYEWCVRAASYYQLAT